MSEVDAIDRLVKALMKLFVNRTDAFAIQKPDGTYRRVTRPLTEGLLKRHLLGKVTLGIFQINPNDNSVKRICFDIDERIGNIKEIAKKIYDCAAEKFGGKAVLLEASRHPDASYHIWVFFEHPIPAYLARYLGRRILKICKLEKTGIELFPKQDTVREGGYGNLVKLPLGLHKKHEKKSCFLDPKKLEPMSNEILFSVNGVPCGEEIHRIFSKVNDAEPKQTALLLGDYWLNFCRYSGGKVWNLLNQWNAINGLSLPEESLVEIMTSVGKSWQDVKGNGSEGRETDFQKQTIILNQKSSLSDIPCVKAFRETPISPSKRHDVLGKNFSILYQKIKGNFQGFKDFASSLAKNQPGFDEKSLDWRRWVKSKPRSFNCIEVRNFLECNIPDFSCSNCLVKVENYYLHPAGGLNEFFVYEPIGQQEYVYKTIHEKRGITKLRKEEQNYFLLIEEQKFFFKEKPPDPWFFNSPRRDTIQKWVDGEQKSKSPSKLWKEIQLCLQTFLDIPNKNEFSVLALFIIQSWITEISETVFYCSLQGEWGGGKTVCGETTIQICRHGYPTGNLTPAFVARAIETQKLTLFVDELDSVAGTEDSDLYQIFRQGYRRRGSYSRVNPNTMKPETFQIFGPKIFSIHSSVEPALQSRTVPIHVRETENSQYPVIGSKRNKFVRKIHDDLFLWYLDNTLEIRNMQPEIDGSEVDIVDQVDCLENGINQQKSLNNIFTQAEKLRETLFKQSTTHLSEGQLNQLSQLKGRNVELAHIMMTLSNLVGIDINKDIAKTFEQKTTEESEPLEIGRMGVLKDVLADIWKEKLEDNNYLTENRYVKVSNKELYDRYNTILRQKSYPGISSHEFKEYLTEFGFSDTLNRKKMKVLMPGEASPQSRLCNIFTPRVLKRLEIETEEPSEEVDSAATNEQPAEEGS